MTSVLRFTWSRSAYNWERPVASSALTLFDNRCRDSEEYKRWKAFQEAEASGDAAGAEAALTELKLRDKDGNEIEKQLPGGKVGVQCVGHVVSC